MGHLCRKREQHGGHYYVGRSDMLQTNVDGFLHPASTNITPCRLGYWRFDTPELMAEQGQIPISQNG